VADQLEAVVVEQMVDVAFAPGVEVVEADDVMSLVDQSFAQMGADKASAARYQNSFHIAKPLIFFI
jgi:hypothetical protein